MKSKLGEEILRLRSLGKSYNQIKSELGCSKGSISYYCGKGQKEKSIRRTDRRRQTPIGKIKRKIENFKLNDKTPKKIRNARDKFFRGVDENIKLENCDFSIDDLYKLISEKPFCYLTGRPINFDDPDSFSLDHIIPRSKNGTNSFDNLGITCKEANYCKRDLLVEDFIQLCKEILINFGFEVKKSD